MPEPAPVTTAMRPARSLIGPPPFFPAEGTMQRVERHLDWPDCLNVRDLGGLPIADGGVIRWGALVRADDLCRLTPVGQRRLAEAGVRTVIDLRGPSEAAAAHPFAAHELVGYQCLPL